MILRTLLMAMAVCGFLFSGCVKKPKQVPQQNVQIPTVPVPAAAPATPAKTDTGDVFNEFYKDSKGKTVDKTFSMKGSGTAESYTPEFSEDGRYVVQIAAGPSSGSADEMAGAFKGKGYPAYVAEVQNPTPELTGTYYRVRIGGFAMLADAKAFGENILRPANYDYWVDLKSNDAVGTGSSVSQTPYSSGTSSYTPSSSEPATPVYTPTTTESNASTTPAATPSPGTTTYDWNAPAATTPAPEPSATTPSTGSSWTTETPSTTPPATPPATPAPSTDTSTGSWGGTGWK